VLAAFDYDTGPQERLPGVQTQVRHGMYAPEADGLPRHVRERNAEGPDGDPFREGTGRTASPYPSADDSVSVSKTGSKSRRGIPAPAAYC
jgi:hypothetical protein